MKELVTDTVSYSAELGAGGERFSAGSFSQAMFITVKVRACTLRLLHCNLTGRDGLN